MYCLDYCLFAPSVVLKTTFLSFPTAIEMHYSSESEADSHYSHDTDGVDSHESSSMSLELNNTLEEMREGGGCKNSPATRRLRCIWALLVVICLFGISAFGNEKSITNERMTQKQHYEFDVNAPPGLEEKIYRKQVFIREEERLEDDINYNASELPFPVIVADDEIPKSPFKETAVEALECRESVINFVINATDAKDECNGLKKAFDMTCNADSESEIRASADRASADAASPQEQAGVLNEEGGTGRRRLFEKKTNTSRQTKPNISLRIYRAVRSLRRFVTPNDDNDGSLFFPEDKVMGDAWDEARYQIQNELDTERYESSRRRLGDALRWRFLDDQEEAVSAEQTQQDANATSLNETVVVKPPTAKKVVSLSLPTKKLHASDQMLSDTLMLSKEKDIEQAVKASNNATNATLNAAQEDAVASAKAVHEAAAAVSAVLNDPESVEARTCCASILNVYHEHCDNTEEEGISDSNLFMIVFVIAFCGVVKSLIRHFRIRWLPEAAGCILVGVLFGVVVSLIPGARYDLSFDGDWFLRIMVPPIGTCCMMRCDVAVLYHRC